MITPKSVLDYISGRDVLEYRRKFHQAEHNLGIKISNNLHEVIAFAKRYVPIGVEIDGLRRIIDGEYIWGTAEIIVAVGAQLEEYSKLRTNNGLVDSVIESQRLMAQYND
nr:hypothetical protein [Nanoarchaeum sp.]